MKLKIQRDNMNPYEAVCSIRELLQRGHMGRALIELREAIYQTPNDSPWYAPMVGAALALEDGRALDARIILHKAVAELEPSKVKIGGRW